MICARVTVTAMSSVGRSITASGYHCQPSDEEGFFECVADCPCRHYDLLGGGIDGGTSTLMVGAAGSGKSTLAALFVAAAAKRGQASAMFLFDESIQTLLSRCAGLGIDLETHVEAGRVTIQPVDPAELSPGEFGHRIQRAVEEQSARVVVIDSGSEPCAVSAIAAAADCGG